MASKTTYSHAPGPGKGGIQTTFSRSAVKVGKGGAVTQFGSGSAHKSKPSAPKTKAPSGYKASGASTKSAGKPVKGGQGASAGAKRGTLSI